MNSALHWGDEQEQQRALHPHDPYHARHRPGDAVPVDAVPWSREFFIPVRRRDLMRLLASKINDPRDRENFLDWCHCLWECYSRNYVAFVDKLKDLYAPLDPDLDHLGVKPLNDEQQDEALDEFFERFDILLKLANYQRLTREEIEEAIGAASDFGVRLHVELAQFDRVEVHVRGDVMGRRVKRHWLLPYKQVEVEVPVYRRLVVVYRLRPDLETEDGDALRLRLFKNIPKMDVDMMLPGGRPQFNLLDRGKIFLPTASGVAFAVYKMIRLIAFAAVVKTFSLLTLVIGAVGYIVKSVFGYYNTRDRYQLNLTRSLYFQQLDSNAGVIHRVADEAAEQEARECMLAYYLLWREAPPEGFTAEELAARAERFMREEFGLEFRFEAEDALQKLAAMDQSRSGRPARHLAAGPPCEILDSLRGGQVFHQRPALWRLGPRVRDKAARPEAADARGPAE